MKVVALNGSPRQTWNTAMLLKEAIKGAQSKGADVELIHLYDLSYKGCISCFACKRQGVILEQCSVKDGLYPVLEKIHRSDVILLGSPIYFGCVTGEMRSLMERLLFPYISYDRKPSSFGRKIKTAFVYTMNVPEKFLDSTGYSKMFSDNQIVLERVFGNSEYLISTETYQFDDYSKYAASMIDAKQRAARRETVFKEELKKAYDLGQRLAAV